VDRTVQLQFIRLSLPNPTLFISVMLLQALALSFVSISFLSSRASARVLPYSDNSNNDTTLVPRDYSIARRQIIGSLDSYELNPNRIFSDLMVGPMGNDGNRQPRQNCIFYVNTLNSEDGKEAAIKYAANMNVLHPGEDYHTLYDVYDSNAAFAWNVGPLAEAVAAKKMRPWFQLTSKQFALLCIGKVWLVVGPQQQIWDGAIWLTDEYPALVSLNGAAGPIVEVDPNEILAGGIVNQRLYSKE
jgi:hypothetical protein